MRQLFKSFDDVTKIKVHPLPTIFPSDLVLTERFSDFFVEKVDKIAQSFSDVELGQTTVVRNHPVFDEFLALSANDVSKLCRLKCSELDVLPTDVFKSVWPLIVPYVTVLLNLSFSQVKFSLDSSCH